ncbi:MAG: protein translocase subunit SecD, partial [Dehalococcoidia bacterium]|nr:protein translocase subunit SecD [Dehalococcoidia bacterium]
MNKKNIGLLILILVLFGFALWSLVPLNTKLLGPDGLTLGLDLKGGCQLLYEADLSQKDPSVTDAEAMAAVVDKIQRRVNEFGTTEPVIQRQGTNRILVQLPGVKDTSEAIELIGKTALLNFREQKLDENGQPVLDAEGNPEFNDEPAKAINREGEEEELTGKYLKSARTDVSQYTASPLVVFEWDSEGAYLFEQITNRNIGNQLAIYLDNELISAPVVQEVIRDRGQIDFNSPTPLEEAENLAIQLNSGALDVPLAIIGQESVDPTLGADSIQKSQQAAIIGIILLLLFMLVYYRLPGFISCISLGIYGVFLLAIFSVTSVTLTLSGIAGAVLSLGMAVDANVLIFERMKEELRAGRTV